MLSKDDIKVSKCCPMIMCSNTRSIVQYGSDGFVETYAPILLQGSSYEPELNCPDRIYDYRAILKS